MLIYLPNIANDQQILESLTALVVNHHNSSITLCKDKQTINWKYIVDNLHLPDIYEFFTDYLCNHSNLLLVPYLKKIPQYYLQDYIEDNIILPWPIKNGIYKVGIFPGSITIKLSADILKKIKNIKSFHLQLYKRVESYLINIPAIYFDSLNVDYHICQTCLQT